MGLSYLPSITSHFLCTGWFSVHFLLRDIENDMNFANALFNQILNALSNFASAFENNYSTLESVSNDVKNVVPYFQCIFDLSLLAGDHMYID